MLVIIRSFYGGFGSPNPLTEHNYLTHLGIEEFSKLSVKGSFRECIIAYEDGAEPKVILHAEHEKLEEFLNKVAAII